jgi:hypothetical protein
LFLDSPGHYPQNGLSPHAWCAKKENLGWWKIQGQSRLLVFLNLRVREAKGNAAEWCSTVDSVEKKHLALSFFLSALPCC